ncbi:PTS system galactitol-specific IIB component [Enterococcus sp. PF1-24]|uniref:PTS sugar transporter subunit IIB n=1 Tax=unclassified Enterococcus TaxID=2608891 RepID=UPI0024736D8D|nr:MULTISPECIES: PTS sugar transporter subunit IIB [unclassified Enterococcus]MDH6364843.1 PTS system galactitol-specific IIB component [Enterococcus sp. PFB1-1]MDH6401933.1 PTS system galactitol-specific IIB component [Enterococcus sp. PF1-24]
MKRKLIVACGSGVATSQTIASKIASKFEDDGIDFPVEAVDYKSIFNELPAAGIYVYVAQPDAEVLAKAEELDIRVFPGIPFLTGMGADEIYQDICDLVR